MTSPGNQHCAIVSAHFPVNTLIRQQRQIETDAHSAIKHANYTELKTASPCERS